MSLEFKTNKKIFSVYSFTLSFEMSCVKNHLNVILKQCVCSIGELTLMITRATTGKEPSAVTPGEIEEVSSSTEGSTNVTEVTTPMQNDTDVTTRPPPGNGNCTEEVKETTTVEPEVTTATAETGTPETPCNCNCECEPDATTEQPKEEEKGCPYAKDQDSYQEILSYLSPGPNYNGYALPPGAVNGGYSGGYKRSLRKRRARSRAGWGPGAGGVAGSVAVSNNVSGANKGWGGGNHVSSNVQAANQVNINRGYHFYWLFTYNFVVIW